MGNREDGHKPRLGHELLKALALRRFAKRQNGRRRCRVSAGDTLDGPALGCLSLVNTKLDVVLAGVERVLELLGLVLLDNDGMLEHRSGLHRDFLHGDTADNGLKLLLELKLEIVDDGRGKI